MILFRIFKYLVGNFILYTTILMFSFAIKSNENIDLRFKEITQKLRCMTCQNQTVYESDAEFSKSIKKIVKEKLNQGLTARQIEDFLAQRYGEYILLEPRLNRKNIFLWTFPFILLCLSAIVLMIRIKNKKYK